MFDAARALSDTSQRTLNPSAAEPRGSAVLGLLYSDNTQSRVIWEASKGPADARLKSLVDQITALKHGGWQ
jgi:hypothetical protein